MGPDIFKFWAQLRPGETVHPADKEIFRRLHPERHGFQLKCLPGGFVGPLRTAPIVLLYLSPGFSDFDVIEAKSREGREYHFRKLTGRTPLPEDESRPGIGDRQALSGNTVCAGSQPKRSLVQDD